MCSSETVDNLQRLLLEYKEAKKFFEEAKAKSGESDVSPQEIDNSIKVLFELQHNGKKIKELYKCQNQPRSKEFKNTEYVHKSIRKINDKKETKQDTKKAKGSDRDENKSERRGKVSPYQ